MKRIYPRQIRDVFFLSGLLDQFLNLVEQGPWQTTLKALSYDSEIPEAILLRLRHLHTNPKDAPNIRPEDFHIVFSNLLFRFPTVRMWAGQGGDVFFEC